MSVQETIENMDNEIEQLLNELNSKDASELFEDFKKQYPNLAKKIYDWGPFGIDSIHIRFNDGFEMIYDSDKKGRIVGRGNKVALINHTRPMTEHEFSKKFSDRLNEMMRKRKVSQKKMAIYLGVSTKLIWDYCNGSVLPDVFSMYKISHCLRMEMNEFLNF